jgi:hypothetical protein
MGYRSDLIVLIYPDVGANADEQPLYDQLKVLMATTFKHVADSHFRENIKWADSHHVLKFDIRDVKWYPSYSDVQMFEAMLEAFRSEEIEGYCTESVRIGEESEDVEERHTGENNQYYLNVRREIDCSV